MLTLLWRVFGRKSTMTEGRPNRELERARISLAQKREEQADLKQRIPDLVAARTYEALSQLDQVRSRLDALAVEIPIDEREVERLTEIHRIVRQLEPIHAMRVGALEKWLERAAMNPDVLSLDEWTEGQRLNRETERLRLILRETTGDEEYARPFDAIAQLRAYWESVEKDRARLIASTGPGHKVQIAGLPWFELADRLARLRAAGPAQKENAHAVR